MSYADFMKQAKDIVDTRAKGYGDFKQFLIRFTQIYEACTGIRLTLREAAMFQHVWKLTRVFEDPHNADHYLDGVNYLAFAGAIDADEQREMAGNTPTLVTPTYTPPTPLKTLNLGERAVAQAVSSPSELKG